MTEYGSRFEWSANEPFLAEKGRGLDWDGARFYRSGRDALKALARCAKGHDTVLLPALCCESMYIPFALNGFRVAFYQLHADLSADLADLRARMNDRTVLLYMRYLGHPALTDEQLLTLRTEFPGALFVEDRTHDLFVARRSAFRPDAATASLRKWAALPEGGVLYTELDAEKGECDRRFGDWRLAAKQKKDRYHKSGDPAIKAEYLADFRTAEAMLDESPIPVRCTEDYAALLHRLDFTHILDRRLMNIRLLADALAPVNRGAALRFDPERAMQSGLYFPLFLNRQKEMQKYLAVEGVYCPILWPQPKDNAGSGYVNDNILCVPCDQRYGQKDMDYIAHSILSAL